MFFFLIVGNCSAKISVLFCVRLLSSSETQARKEEKPEAERWRCRKGRRTRPKWISFNSKKRKVVGKIIAISPQNTPVRECQLTTEKKKNRITIRGKGESAAAAGERAAESARGWRVVWSVGRPELMVRIAGGPVRHKLLLLRTSVTIRISSSTALFSAPITTVNFRKSLPSHTEFKKRKTPRRK